MIISNIGRNKLKAFISFLNTNKDLPEVAKDTPIFTTQTKLTDEEIINKFNDHNTSGCNEKISPIIITYPKITNINEFDEYLLQNIYDHEYIYYYCKTFNIVFVFYDIHNFAFQIASSNYFLCLILYDTKYFQISTNDTKDLLNIISLSNIYYNDLFDIKFKDDIINNKNTIVPIKLHIRNFVMSGLWTSHVGIVLNKHNIFLSKIKNALYDGSVNVVVNNINYNIIIDHLSYFDGNTLTFKLINFLYKSSILDKYACIYNINDMLTDLSISKELFKAKNNKDYVENIIEDENYILPINIVNLYKFANLESKQNCKINEIKKIELSQIETKQVDEINQIQLLSNDSTLDILIKNAVNNLTSINFYNETLSEAIHTFNNEMIEVISTFNSKIAKEKLLNSANFRLNNGLSSYVNKPNILSNHNNSTSDYTKDTSNISVSSSVLKSDNTFISLPNSNSSLNLSDGLTTTHNEKKANKLNFSWQTQTVTSICNNQIVNTNNNSNKKRNNNNDLSNILDKKQKN